MNPNGISRVRILGKRSKNIDVAKYVKNQLQNPNITKAHLAKSLGMSRPTLNSYTELADVEKIEVEQKIIKKIDPLELTNPEFLKRDSIQVWTEFINRKARGGKAASPKLKSKYLITFWNVCNTLKCPPENFCLGESINDVLDQGRKLTQQFFDIYMRKEAKVKYSKNWNADKVNQSSTKYRYAQVIRDFMKSQGYSYPAGESGIMSQSVTPFHGKYSDVRITEEIHQAILEDLKNEFGAKSEEWLFYAYSMEIFSRSTATRESKPQYTEIEVNGKPVYITQVYENKTKQYKKGIWTKYVFDPRIQKRLREIQNQEKIFLEINTPNKLHNHMIPILKRYFKKYNLTDLARENQDDESTSFFLKRPTHALRHAGAQRLLLATNWNLGFVAKRGWKKVQELTDSYGDMPPAQEAKILESVEF